MIYKFVYFIVVSPSECVPLFPSKIRVSMICYFYMSLCRFVAVNFAIIRSFIVFYPLFRPVLGTLVPSASTAINKDPTKLLHPLLVMIVFELVIRTI